jgi:acylphosphatase
MTETGPAEKSFRRIVRVRVEGLVQGVGFRMFVYGAAVRNGVDGFVRNRRDGGVEAVFAGTSVTVDAMIAACRDGPRGARVAFVKVLDEHADVAAGFSISATV